MQFSRVEQADSVALGIKGDRKMDVLKEIVEVMQV